MPSRRPSSACCRQSTACAAEVGPPTEFEALTAAAIAELARREVDLAIVEVGIGGRLDATNVLDLGVAADHQRPARPRGSPRADPRGHRRREGADHQARQPGGHRRAGPRAATDRRSDAPPWTCRCGAPARASRIGPSLRRQRLGRNRRRRPDPDTAAATASQIGLLGRHQAAERGGGPRAARRARRALGRRRRRVGAAARTGRGALARAASSCSTARCVGVGRVLLDGAHNPAGAAALADRPRRPRPASPDDRLRRDAGKRVDGGAARALAPLEPTLRLHPGGRSRRPRSEDPGAGVAIRLPGRPRLTAADRRGRRSGWPTATRWSSRVRSTSSARSAACSTGSGEEA